MIDIELKGAMDEYSHPSLRNKIYKLYAEAEDPQLKDFQIGHLAFMVGEGIDPTNVQYIKYKHLIYLLYHYKLLIS